MIEPKTLAEWQRILDNVDEHDADLLHEIACIYDTYYECIYPHGYETEDGIIPVDLKKAFEFYTKAHALGNIDSTIMLAHFYSDIDEEVCERNFELAIELYQIGIENGYAMASTSLALLYRDMGNYKKAFQQLLTTEIMEKVPSLVLACYYHYGIGTPVNKRKAFESFKKITDETNACLYSGYELDDANYYVGLYYLEGVEVEQCFTTAREYFIQANADDDHRPAHEALLLIREKE